VRAGEWLRIVDLGGNQAVDCLFYVADDPTERYSAADTIVGQRNIYLVSGSELLSNEGRVMLTVGDTAVAHHDTIGGACSRESNTLRYGHHTLHQHACVDNFLTAGAPFGLAKRDLVSNINWFMNVPVGVDGLLASSTASRHGAARRRAGRGRRDRPHLQLPADQQPLQRLRPHADPAHGRRAHQLLTRADDAGPPMTTAAAVPTGSTGRPKRRRR